MLTTLFALALAQGPTPAATQSPPYRYRLEVRTSREVDQSAMGRPKLSEGLATTALISVVTRDSADGIVAEATVDSLTLDPSGALADQLRNNPGLARSARGARVSQYIVRGRIHGPPVFSDSTNQALGAVAQALAVLFPSLRRGAKVGESWSDTTNIVAGNASQTQQPQTNGQVISVWKVVGNEGNALVLDGNSTTHTKTDDPGHSQSMTLSGTTHEHVVIPPTGPLHRATIETINDMAISVPGMSAPIPGKTTASLSLIPLP
jgi:hypothetical protein